jgi:hypothetical protein
MNWRDWSVYFRRVVLVLCQVNSPRHPSGDAPNVATAALTVVAHGGNPQDRTTSPRLLVSMSVFTRQFWVDRVLSTPPTSSFPVPCFLATQVLSVIKSDCDPSDRNRF